MPEIISERFIGELSPGYELLTSPLQIEPYDQLNFAPNSDYERYLRIHKVFVGNRGASTLEEIHEGLKNEYMPRYLAAAGWAAAEAAVVRSDSPTRERLQLLAGGVACWQQAVHNQRWLNTYGPEYLAEYAMPHRMALDVAVAPLMQGIIVGDITPLTCQRVFEDSLRVAQSNIVQLNLMAREGNMSGLAEHIGFGYESNALLAFNRRLSPTWFVIPSMVRSDSGHYYQEQTHDLLVIHQKKGNLLDVTPVEIKAAASARDRERYRALSVRGKMHLSMDGRYTPDHTLDAITASYGGYASPLEKEIADSVSNRFMKMARDYYAGDKLGSVATSRSHVAFRDNAIVAANHPGLLARSA